MNTFLNAAKKLAQDPGWWLTAVFVGLVVSTIAGFLKDGISRVLAASSSGYRRWRDARRREYLSHVEHISRDIGLVLYRRLMAVHVTIMWSVMIMIILSAYIISKLSVEYHTTATFALIFFGITSFFPYFLIFRNVRIASDARAMYERRLNSKKPNQTMQPTADRSDA